MALRRLKESTFRKFRKLRTKEAAVDTNPLGTPVAEYAETGPYHCADCIWIKKRDDAGDRGICVEPHMKKDPKTKKNKAGNALVILKTGCCRFVKPPKKK